MIDCVSGNRSVPNKQSDQPEPPWIKVPDVDASWAGWRQGAGEDWLCEVWLPFWHSLDDKGRRDYLERYPVPNDDWQLQLDYFWKP